jgi:replicative DNA helicase
MNAISNIDAKAERLAANKRDQDRAPRNIEVEQALLGAMLRVPGLYAEVAGILEPGHFWVPEHIELFGIITRREGRNLTPASLKAEFEARTELPVDFLYDLSQNIITVTPANVAHYGHTIRAMAQRRSLIGLAQEMKERAEDLTVDESPDDMIGAFNGELSDIASVSATFESAGSVAKRVVTNLDKPIDADLTGIEALDEVLMGGLHTGRFYGFGGRFKGGKSFLLSSMSYNLAEAGVPHVYLTLESGAEQLVERFLARKMGRNAMVFQDQRRRCEPAFMEAAQRASEWLDKTPLVVRRKPRMTLHDLKATLAQIGMSKKYRGVIVDYLQLVTGQQRGDSLTVHYEQVAQTLAEAAVNYGIWVVVAFQINSEGGPRHGEGLLLACDAAFALTVTSKEESLPSVEPGAYLECLAHRYGPAQDVGDENYPKMAFDKRVGPHFRNVA